MSSQDQISYWIVRRRENRTQLEHIKLHGLNFSYSVHPAPYAIDEIKGEKKSSINALQPDPLPYQVQQTNKKIK
jgi:hypothetical protein